MAPAILTQQRLKELLHYNSDTGIFTCLVYRGANAKVEDIAGCTNRQGYVQIKIDQKTHSAHRLAFLYVTGRWPIIDVDHKDKNPSNNSWLNLREATESVNMQNQRGPHKNNRLGILGVHRSYGKFLATIWVDGANKRLGRFDTPEEATAAYIEAKRQLHPGCTI